MTREEDAKEGRFNEKGAKKARGRSPLVPPPPKKDQLQASQEVLTSNHRCHMASKRATLQNKRQRAGICAGISELTIRDCCAIL
jgi:hypothetical protein